MKELLGELKEMFREPGRKEQEGVYEKKRREREERKNKRFDMSKTRE